MRKYPYSREVESFQSYFDKFAKLKTEKKSFRFIVVRTSPSGKKTWDTNLLVALEEIKVAESADDGDDVIISFKLKQFKEYGVKTLKIPESKPKTTSTSNKPRDTKKQSPAEPVKTYTVKRGDCLWNISKKFYGKGSEWKKIYNANKSAIENDAKKHGKKSSSNGHWIWPGLKLTIPSE